MVIEDVETARKKTKLWSGVAVPSTECFVDISENDNLGFENERCKIKKEKIKYKTKRSPFFFKTVALVKSLLSAKKIIK